MSIESILLVLAGLALAPVLLAIGRLLRTRRKVKRRVVEKPNSHYTAPLVRDVEVRHRWHDIVLDRVHEINRAEVVRLIGKADAAGVDSLRPGERAFLDQMVEIAGRAPEPKVRERPQERGTLELRERPA